MTRKLLVIDVAALSREVDIPGLRFHRAESVFPAVTCSVQASFRTASLPCEHGMIGNGLLLRELSRPMFWEQSAGLVTGRRIWEDFRSAGGRIGLMFWQQSLGEEADLLLSPQPIHKHHGGMIESFYSQPPGLYGRLCRQVGGAFKLRHYWGPLASAKVGNWITRATAAVMDDVELAPDLLLTYLPSLDYDLQRFGPNHDHSRAAHVVTSEQLRLLLAAADRNNYDVLLFGDYAIGAVERAVFPNRALADAGLLKLRGVAGMLYPDMWASAAFAVADHEVAHVYVHDLSRLGEVRDVLVGQSGVTDVLDRDGRLAVGLDHPNSGELVLLADEGAWLAYPWWTDPKTAPDYATHVDIHNKPGYDPCELFLSLWPPMSVSQDTARIRGSHGRIGGGREVVWAATCDMPGEIRNIVDLAAAVRTRLGK